MLSPQAYPRRPLCLVLAIGIGDVAYVVQTNRPYRGRVRRTAGSRTLVSLDVAVVRDD